MSNNKYTYLFELAQRDIYQRITYPHLVKVLPINKCLQDLDLLAKSIAYTIITPYDKRRYNKTYHWQLLSKFICNSGEKYVSLVFNKPTCISDLRVTYINNIQDLKLYPNLKDKVLDNLLETIK